MKNKKKNFPPSPPSSLPILGHLHLLKKPLHQSLARLSAKHGPLLLLRFGFRPVLVVSSASLAEECLKTNDIVFPDRPQFSSVSVTTYNYTNIPFTSYGPQWREMRRIATLEALSSHRLEFFADVRAEEVRALARHLFRNSGRVELRTCLFRLAVNIITKTISGIRYYEDDGENDKDVYKFKEVNEKINSLSSMTNVGDFLPAMIGWIARHGVKRKMARYHKYRDEIIRSLIEKHRRKRMEEKDNKNGKLKEK
ncbi:cytochrome P450 81F3-like, partial [Phalaenopsis equestris]|uniref:cytochrome P450 81F3-like n=1 Tax=Phalaenopsis equestris TaxID=78828 RepID=UPI0009E31C1C